MGMKQGARSFTVAWSDVRIKGGRYIIEDNENPSQAAARAATKLFVKLGKRGRTGVQKVIFILRETTKGSSKTMRKYEVQRTPMKNPRKIFDQKGKLLYTVKFNYDIEFKGVVKEMPSSS